MNESDAIQFEDPISLNFIYCPITIKGDFRIYAPVSYVMLQFKKKCYVILFYPGTSPPHVFSAPLLDEFTHTSKYDLLNEQPLVSDWRVVSDDLDKKISFATVTVPLSNGGMFL